MDAYWQAPPVTRTLVAATVLTSILFYSGILPAYYFIFSNEAIFASFPPQLWRLLTPFWVTGPKFSMLMDPVALWQYSNAIETGSPRFQQRKGDYFVYIVFIMTIILALSGVVLSSFIFMDPFLLALAYTFAQENPHRTQTFFIASFPARYLPFVMLALTFVMTGGSMSRVYNQAMGLIAAHAYDFITKIWPTFGGGRNWIEWATPRAVRTAFGEGSVQARSVRNTGFGTVYGSVGTTTPAGQNVSAGRSTGSSWGSSWGGRGQGRRLGGD